MIILLSPSKKLDFSINNKGICTQPIFLEKTKTLITILKQKKQKQIGSLMGLSEALAKLNYERFQEFSFPFNEQNAKQAIFAFKGDVYDGLNSKDFNKQDMEFACHTLRILSGLYGLLKPSDLIKPYRLEMGTKLINQKGKNLYEFWGNDITEKINNNNKNGSPIINLASNEYFKAIKPKLLNGEVITPIFMDYNKGKYKTLMLYAKRARGAMARYIIKNRIKAPEQIKEFDSDGYQFNSKLSHNNNWVFTRK